MERIIKEMQKFNFTKMEAKTYIEVLKNPGYNGYELANILNVPRSTVYSNLNNLYIRGAVYQINGESKRYKAKNPKILFEEISSEYSISAKEVSKELESLSTETHIQEYINIEGYKNNVSKIKEMINQTEKELFINCGMIMSPFSEELEKAKERGVRIILFTLFEELYIETKGCEVYKGEDRVGKKEEKNIKIKVVSDIKRALIGSGRSDKFLGTYSENDYFISTISTYFHLDIYLNKLSKKFGRNLVTEDILVSSLHEKKYKRGL